MSKPTARTLLKSPEDLPSRKEALVWAKLYQENLLKALEECPRGDWLIWMMARLKVKPKLLLAIAHQCISIAISELDTYGDMTFRQGLYIVDRWLAGEASSENCQDILDDLDYGDRVEELLPNNPIPLANEIVSCILNACIDIDEESSTSNLAYDLAWAIYTAAKLQVWGEVRSLEQVLEQHANYIRQSLRNTYSRDFG